MQRLAAMLNVRRLHRRTFITVEPVLDFDVEVMLGWMEKLRAEFINIGADSKGAGLVEPGADKVRALIAGIQAAGIEIRQKHNLGRLLK